MRRRNFVTLLGGAAAWPLAARAQQAAMPVIGFLASYSSDDAFARYHLPAFHQGLKEAGYVDGRNVTIEYRWAGGRYDQMPALAADLVNRRVTTIVAIGGPAGSVAQAATTTIPIVFSGGGDPVKLGLVSSLNQPGGNATGVVTLNAELGPKRLELLHELVPAMDNLAVLLNPTYRVAETLSKDLEAAAQALGLRVHVLHASTEREIDAAFATLVRLKVAGLVVGTDVFFNTRMEQLAALALRHAMPTIYQYRAFAVAGGLISYGGNITDLYRQVGIYTGRILTGVKPADLPVHQLTKVELIINLKTAKALGLTVPIPLLGRADEVIE
jgi:putative ABC transport system substrate-binding protein